MILIDDIIPTSGIGCIEAKRRDGCYYFFASLFSPLTGKRVLIYFRCRLSQLLNNSFVINCVFGRIFSLNCFVVTFGKATAEVVE